VERGFRDLLVYRRAVALADELTEAVRDWSSEDRWTIGVQAMRAADSIGANLAEAHGRGPFPDRRRFLFIARGSGFELEHWLERAEQRKLAIPNDAPARAREISRMLNGLTRSWR
jgi:four helix bundle protein